VKTGAVSRNIKFTAIHKNTRAIFLQLSQKLTYDWNCYKQKSAWVVLYESLWIL